MELEYKHACAVDARGFYKDLVLLYLMPVYSALMDSTPDAQTGTEWVVQGYAMKAGESLVETEQPTSRAHAGAAGFIRSRWTGEAWEEGAAPEEIAAWEVEHSAPEIPPPGPVAVLQEQNKLLAAQVAALRDQSEFQEELIVELAGVVYA